MSALDAEFLNVEDGVHHMHIAACALFEGPVPAFDDVLTMHASVLDDIPRYRQRVRMVPFQLHRPVWVDDPHFSLPYHVRRTALPEPGGEAELCSLMGRVMSQELDRNRPLWETWMVEGLDDGRWALLTKVHHCMVDGIAGTDLMNLVLDREPRTEFAPGAEWRPADEPSPLGLVTDALTELTGEMVGRTLRLPELARDPGRTVQRLRDIGAGMWSLGGELRPAPETSIEGAVGPHRRWAASSADLDDAKRVRKALGGTVNDAVLAAVCRGFRDLLESRGEDPAEVELRSLIPVSLRVEHGALDNQVTALVAELPVGVEDPEERYAAVLAETERLKASHEAEAGEAVTASLDAFAPPLLVAIGTRAAINVMQRFPQRTINTVTTNVPGPQYPLYAGPSRMLEYRPFVPIFTGVRVGVAILSYDGGLFFGVTGDYDTVPDVAVLAEGIAEGMTELVELT